MKFLKSLFLESRVYYLLWGLVFCFVLGFIWQLFFAVAQIATGLVFLTVCVDLYLLYANGSVTAERVLPARLSNGDLNAIGLILRSGYQFTTTLFVIDELPEQFQIRDFLRIVSVPAWGSKQIEYQLRPVTRGEYTFGAIKVYVSSPLRLIQRGFSFAREESLPVYPSFIQMKKIELLAIANRLTETGIKKIRRIGNATEFEQIKDYVPGDDYRTINWKATARRSKLMVNSFDEEKAQQVYNVIDMSRVMKMPFENMSLVDYAINASLALSKVVIQKHDKAGIITFSDKVSSILPADDRPAHMGKIFECLYKQTTHFQEADFGALAMTLLTKISHRSLIVLYTNFETIDALRRQLPFLRRLAENHVLVVVFFENTELHDLLRHEPESVEEVYIKTIAEKFSYEKRQIARELSRYKIHAVLTQPSQLSVNTINKYLELKARTII